MVRIVFCLLVVAPLIASAEEPGRLTVDHQLTLSNVVEAAYVRSPRQAVLRAGNSVVIAREIQAGSPLPGAPALVARHQSDAIGSGRKLVEWEAGLEIPLWLPGQRAAREAVAQEVRSELTAGQNGLKLLIAGQVRDAVWALELNRSAAALAETRLRTAQSLQADVEKRWKAGELAKTDTLLVQNETLQAQTQWLRAVAELNHAEHRYWMLTGLKQLPQVAGETRTAQAGINDSHPLLAEESARVELARSERNLVQTERRENPQLAFNTRHERGAFDTEFNNSIGVSLRIPLDAEVRAAPMLASAEMALGEAMSRHAQQKINLQALLHEAEHNLETTLAELGVIEYQQSLTQENLRLAKKSFDMGESDLVSLLRVQALARETEVALGSRRIQLQWDIARYNQAVGVLP